MFERAFSAHAGTISATCELCGTHIATLEGLERYGDEGELEAFEANVAKDPKHYVLWEDCDGVSLGYVDGRTFIYGCECRLARKYENFIRAHRYDIAEYLRAFAKKTAERRQWDEERLGEIPTIEQLVQVQ